MTNFMPNSISNNDPLSHPHTMMNNSNSHVGTSSRGNHSQQQASTVGTTATTVSSMLYSNKNIEFRQYLDRTGVLDAFTKVLVGLYEEPDRHSINAMEYIKKYLGVPINNMDVDGLREENEQLKEQIQRLKQQIQSQQQQQQQFNRQQK